jgi:sialidase-1
MKKKHLFPLVLILFFLGACANTDYETTELATFSLQQVPVIQGSYTPVGQLRIDPMSGPLEHLQLDVRSEYPLAGIRVTELGGEGEQDHVLFEQEKVSGSIAIPLQAAQEEGERVLSIHIMPATDMPLVAKIGLYPSYVELGGSKYAPTMSGSQKPLRIAKSVRTHGDDGVHSYRIPGLVTSKKGSLLAVYDVRRDKSGDLQGDIDVGLSRSTDGGETWEPMRIIMDMGTWGDLPENQNGVGDPAILVDELTGFIHVVALWMHGKPDAAAWISSQPGLDPSETGQLLIVSSEDDGLTWSEPRNITQPMKDPSWHLFLAGPGMGITMKDGTLVFAAQFKDALQVPHSTLIYSKDRGNSWFIGQGARPNTTESQVVELNDGSLMLNMRDDRGGSRAVMTSTDLGTTWEEHATHRKALIEPICMGSLIRIQTGESTLLLFSNPNTTDGRYNITIKASFDEGVTWPEENQVLLDQEPGWGYSCLTRIDAEPVGILYESSQANMTFQKIKLSELASTSGQ